MVRDFTNLSELRVGSFCLFSNTGSCSFRCHYFDSKYEDQSTNYFQRIFSNLISYIFDCKLFPQATVLTHRRVAHFKVRGSPLFSS